MIYNGLLAIYPSTMFAFVQQIVQHCTGYYRFSYICLLILAKTPFLVLLVMFMSLTSSVEAQVHLVTTEFTWFPIHFSAKGWGNEDSNQRI